MRSRGPLQSTLASVLFLVAGAWSCSAAVQSSTTAGEESKPAGDVRAAMVRGDWAGALRLLDENLRNASEQAELWLYLRGLALDYDGQHEPALSAFVDLEQRFPASLYATKSRFQRAEILRRLGRHAEAEQLWEAEAQRLRSDARQSELAAIYIELADGLSTPPATPSAEPSRIDYGAAYGLYAKVLDLAAPPKDRAKALLRMGLCMERLQRWAECARDSDTFLAEFDAARSAKSAGVVGVDAVLEVRLRRAQALLRQGLNPHARRAFEDLAEDVQGMFAGRAPYGEALKALDEAARVRVLRLESDARLAIAEAFEVGNAREALLAVAALRRFLAAAPGHPRAAFALSRIAEHESNHGRSEQALQALDELLALPQPAAGTAEEREEDARLRMQAVMTRGGILSAQKRFELAIAAFQEYAARFPSGPDWSKAQSLIVETEYRRAQEHGVSEHFEAARAAWRAFLAAHPLDGRAAAIAYAIGELYVVEATALLAGEPGPDPTPAASARAAELRRAAVDEWRKLVQRFPNTEESSRALLGVGRELEEHLGDLDGAVAAYRACTFGSAAGEAMARLQALLQPSLALSTKGVWRAPGKPRITAQVRNLERLKLELYRLDLETYFRKHRTHAGVEDLDLDLITADERLDVDVAKYVRYAPLEVELELPVVGPGTWVVAVTGGEVRATTLVIASDIDVIVKSSSREVFVFAEDVVRGEPAAKVRVIVALGAGESTQVLELETGADGVARKSFGQPQTDGPLAVLALRDGHVASVGLSLAGLQLGQVLVPRGLVYTDRPAYRPGQDVGWRAIVREADGERETFESGAAYYVEALDPAGRAFQRFEPKLSAFGTLDGSLTLDAAAPSGSYRIVVHSPKGSVFAGEFQVQTYELQKIDLEFSFDRPVVHRGERVVGEVRAAYYYGEPVADAPLRLAYPDGTQFDLRTDARGVARLDFDTRDMSYEGVIVFSATLLEENVTRRGLVRLAQHEFSATLSVPREVVLAGDTVEAELATRGADGEPLGRALVFVVLRRESSPLGTWGEVEVSRQDVATDVKSGLARVSAKLERGGSYVLRAQATDRFGNLVVAQAAVFASGADDDVRLRLIAEDGEVEVGGQARVQVVNRSGAGLALLTLEGDGVLEHRLLRLVEGTSSVEFAILSQAFPRAWVAIARMDGGKFHAHSVPLKIVRRLDVKVEPLASVYAPGAKAGLRITATDQLGHPAQAELSVAVVDEALFDLYADETPALAAVFDRAPLGELQVRTLSSCTFAYAGRTVRIAQEIIAEARREQAEAEWAEQRQELGAALSGLTAQRRAPGAPAPQVAEKHKDELFDGVEAKGGGGGQFGGRSGGRRNLKARGGAGTESASDMPAPPESETALWKARLVTGADGTAVVEFDLPGQSTRWRATCRGVTASTLVGEATASFQTRAEFFVELRTSPGFVEGDRPRMVARVHNLTGAQGTVELKLRVQAGDSLVTLPAQVELGEAPVVEHVFDELAALPACGVLALRLEATGTLADTPRSAATESSIPVRPWGVEGADSASGLLASDATVWLELESGAAWKNRTLELLLGPGLQDLLVAEALGDVQHLALRAGCLPPSSLADSASDLYGTARVLGLLAATGTAAGEDQRRLFAHAQSRVTELVAAQLGDGSWPWTRGPQASSHVETSCLAFAALGRAAGAGLRVPPQTSQAAGAFLQRSFQGASQQDDELKALIVWALAVQDNDDFAAANRLHRARATLSPAALAFTTLALLEMERAPMAAEVAEVLATKVGADSRGRARVGLAGNLPWHGSQVEANALAVYAIGRASPSSPKLAELVAALLAERPWQPVRARGFALAALAWHAQASAPTLDRSSVEVTLQGQPARRVELEAGRAGAVLEFALADDAPAKVRVDLKLSGGGRPHYAAVLRGFSASVERRDGVAGLRVREQRELAAPPVYRGREIGIGFSVVRNASGWTNSVEHLPLGQVATYRVDYEAPSRIKGDERTFDYLVLEIPLPAGTRLVDDSLQGTFAGQRVVGGTLIVELGQARGGKRLEFRVVGTQPGRYRVLPAILRSAYDPSRRAVGLAHEFEVLGRGAASTDAYKPTPDELFNLGRACYQAGDKARAYELLRALYDAWEPQLHDAQLREAAEALLYLSLERDDPREVVRYFEVLREKNPDLTIPFEQIFAVGAAYRRLDEHERALLIFKATVEETFGKDLKVLGALDAAKDADAALRTFQRLLADYPDFPGSMEAQLAFSDRLLALAPKASEDASLRKAHRDRASLTKDGVQVLQRFLAMHPRDPLAPEAGLNLVNAYLSIEDYARTSELGREFAAVYTQPRYADAFLYAAAVADWYRGEDESAQELLKRIAAALYPDAAGVERPSPNHDLALYILAQIHHARQEFGSAAEYYERVEALFADAREALAGIREKRIALPEITTARPGAKVELALTHRNVARAELAVYPVDLMTLYLREKTLANVAGIELAGISPTLRRTVEFARDEQLRTAEQKVELELREAGAYLVIARGDELHASGLVLVTDLDLEVREDAQFGWLRIQVLRHSDSSYVRGADVKVVGSQSQRIVSGATDPRGLFVADGVVGTSTVIARLGEREYAFFRGSQVLGHMPVSPTGGLERQAGEPQLDQQGYFQNVLSDNDAFRLERANKLQEEITRDRKGVQVKQVK